MIATDLEDNDGRAELVVGAPAESGYGGGLYYFRGGPAGLATTSAGHAIGDASGELAMSLAAGDFDGDGYQDLIAGAPAAWHPEVSSNDGEVWMYRGSATGLIITPPHTWLLSAHLCCESNFGFSVGAGDIDGDGVTDMLVGAPRLATDAGGVFVFVRPVRPPVRTRSWDSSIAAPAGPRGFFGASLF